METAVLVSILMAIVASATPILLAALGELVAEKAGVLNLGVEGMMLVGAVFGFAAASVTGFGLAGVGAAMLGGLLASLLFGFMTLSLSANQVATGLALTIFGIGLSALVGEGFVGKTVDVFGPIFPAPLAEHPHWRILFGHSPLVYFSFLMTAAVAWFLVKTRGGLKLRAVGENAASAHAIGYSVTRVRYAAVAFGGAMAGIGGSYYSLVLTPMWSEEMTAGRGWIALALVVFSAWRPWWLLAGAYFFGLVMTLELHLKAAGITVVAPELLTAMPYLATVAALTLIQTRKTAGASAPASLGQSFRAGG